jgi:hypothetical protein
MQSQTRRTPRTSRLELARQESLATTACALAAGATAAWAPAAGLLDADPVREGQRREEGCGLTVAAHRKRSRGGRAWGRTGREVD